MSTQVLDPAIPDDNKDYWRVYHSDEILSRFDQIVKVHHVVSTGVQLHVDVYEQADMDAPVIIFNHGGGGYSRLFLPLAIEMYDRGYTLIVPDQRGQGLSEGSRRDFVLSQFVQNIVDVTLWARERYTGKLFMAGGSLGGALTYMAVSAGAPVTAMVCHNLYDFGNPPDTMAVSRFARLESLPAIPTFSAGFTWFLARIFPSFPIPYQMMGRFDKMLDARNTDFFSRYKHDPYPIKWVTLRYLASLFNTPPSIRYEDNTVPVVVINQKRDEMVSSHITRRNYDRLGGDKAYAEIDYGHWAIGHGFETEWVDIVDRFLKQFH